MSVKKGDVIKHGTYGVCRVEQKPDSLVSGAIKDLFGTVFYAGLTHESWEKVDEEAFILKPRPSAKFTAFKRSLKACDKYETYQGCRMFKYKGTIPDIGASCMAYLQNDKPYFIDMDNTEIGHCTWVGPQKGHKIPISDNQFKKFKAFVSSLHPKIKEKVRQSRPTLSHPVVNVDTGHGYLNYMFMTVWRLVWQTPKLVLVTNYLKDHGFTNEEVLILLTLFKNEFADHSYSFILENDILYDEYLIRMLKGIEKEKCDARYSMQNKLSTSDKYGKKIQCRWNKAFISVDVLSRIDVLKEFIRDNFWVEIGSVCGPSKFPNERPAKAKPVPRAATEGPGWYVRGWDDMMEEYGPDGDGICAPLYFNRGMRQYCNTRVPQQHQAFFRIDQDKYDSVYWDRWVFSRGMVEWRE